MRKFAGAKHHHFLGNLFATRDHVATHLKEPSNLSPKCHGDAYGKRLGKSKQRDIQKALGYEGTCSPLYHLHSFESSTNRISSLF